MSLPSKSTEKSTSPCAACQKEGALLRCVPCRDVGIDIFFCNRDCQAKLWKQHKAFCGKASTTSDSAPKDASSEKKRAKSYRKVLKETNQKCRGCYNCLKTEKEGVKLSSCSSCDNAAYCSQKCQKAHWPKHKKLCKQNSAARQVLDCTLSASEKNIQNLFEQWRSNPVMKMGTLYAKCQQIMDISEYPPTKIMRAILEFDYNLQTFVHAEEPSVIPLCQCPQEWLNALESMLSQGNELKSLRSSFKQYALVTCNEMGSHHQRVMEMHFAEACLNTPMEELIEAGNISKDIPLKSDLFDGWNDIRKSNLKKQFDHLKTSPIYTGFLCNAMQLFNNKLRLSFCGIVIYVKMGSKDLGKIIEFVKYEKMSKSEIKTLLENSPNGDILELPRHLQQPPVMVIAVYKNIENNSNFDYDYSHCNLNTSGNKSVKTYKRNAEYCFKQLQDSVKKIPAELIEKVSL